MQAYTSFNLRYSPLDADQFRAPTVDEVKAHLLDKIRDMKARVDISEENRQYWLDKYAQAVIVERIVIESVVQ